MSAIKLPQFPTVRIGGKELGQVWFRAHEVRAYAESAVREALAAQKPVAWMTEDGRVSTEATKQTAMPNASKAAFCIPLALIPEKDHG